MFCCLAQKHCFSFAEHFFGSRLTSSITLSFFYYLFCFRPATDLRGGNASTDAKWLQKGGYTPEPQGRKYILKFLILSHKSRLAIFASGF